MIYESLRSSFRNVSRTCDSSAVVDGRGRKPVKNFSRKSAANSTKILLNKFRNRFKQADISHREPYHAPAYRHVYRLNWRGKQQIELAYKCNKGHEHRSELRTSLCNRGVSMKYIQMIGIALVASMLLIAGSAKAESIVLTGPISAEVPGGVLEAFGLVDVVRISDGSVVWERGDKGDGISLVLEGFTVTGSVDLEDGGAPGTSARLIDLSTGDIDLYSTDVLTPTTFDTHLIDARGPMQIIDSIWPLETATAQSLADIAGGTWQSIFDQNLFPFGTDLALSVVGNELISSSDFDGVFELELMTDLTIIDLRAIPDLTAVPLPGSFAMLALAVACLGFIGVRNV